MHRKRQLWSLGSCLLALALTATMPATPAAADISWQVTLLPSAAGYVELSAVDVVSNQTWVGGTEFTSRDFGPATGKPVVGFVNGNTVSVVPSPGPQSFDARLADLTIIGDDVLAVVNATTASGITQPVIQRYSRTQLGQSEVLPSPTVGAYAKLTAITSLADGRALTVGATGSSSVHSQTLVLEQNQNHDGWLQIPSASPGTGTNQLNAVTTTDSGWAVGHYGRDGVPTQSHLLVLHNAGSAAGWTQINVPDQGPNYNELTGIAVTESHDVFIAGWTGSTTQPEQRTAVAMHWNQQTWEVLQPSSGNVTQFNDVTVNPDGTVLFAGYAIEGVVEVARLEKWTGDPHLQLVPTTMSPPLVGVSSYPASGFDAIDAGSTGTQLCAVGWAEPQEGKGGVMGATLRQTALS